MDLDATLEFDKLTAEQLNDLDAIALNFGMKKKDFLSFLEVDQDEAETKRSKETIELDDKKKEQDEITLWDRTA